MTFLQATIGIDFLSKTMYLEDRTVRILYCNPVIFLWSLKITLLEQLKACMCTLL